MANSKNKKNAKQVRVLIASVILAGVITVGGTFAWFTSKDEVTNKLTATNNYGVTIKENFTPPKVWTPGQKVKKEVGVVNTGNIDAFVKLSVGGTMGITTKDAGEVLPATAKTDESTKATTYTYVAPGTDGVYAKVGVDTTDLVTLSDDERASIQAGGRLVYTTSTATADVPGNVGTGFAPTSTGLYIFERAIDNNTYTYNGYYFVSTGTTAGTGTYYAINIPASAITRNDDGTVTFDTAYKETIVTNQDSTTTTTNNLSEIVTLTSTKTVNITPTLCYDKITATSGDQYIQAIYCVNNVTNDADKTTSHTNCKGDIKINIYLNGTFTQDGTTKVIKSDNWTYNPNDNSFYYNKILGASGSSTATSANLISTVAIDSNVSTGSYYELEYDLNIISDSVQVVYDNDGKIVPQTVKKGTSTTTSDGTTSLQALLEAWEDYVTNGTTITENQDASSGKTIDYDVTWAFVSTSSGSST